MSAGNERKEPTGGRTLLAIGLAACIAVLLALVWLEIAEAPLVGQSVLYAGGMILMFSPLMWLGFFLVVLPSSIAALRPEGERSTAESLATFGLFLPLGCVLLVPGMVIVTGQYREKMQDEARDWRRRQDEARVREVVEQGGDLRQFKDQSPETERALSGFLGQLDASQLHLLTPAYMDHPLLMASIAFYSTDADDLRSICARYKDSARDASSIMENLVKNSRTPPDALVQLATSRYGYILVDNPRFHEFPAAERLRILQRLMAGKSNQRRSVGGSPYATSKMLEELASDGEAAVRIRVAQNPSTPLDILQVLARDKEAAVSGRAIRALQEHQELAKR